VIQSALNHLIAGELVWVWPWLLLALPLPLLIYRFAPARSVASGLALRVPDLSRFAMDRAHTKRVRIDPLALVLLMMMWCALLLAAARPQALGEPIDVATEGRDLLLAIDISPSMETDDIVIGNRRSTRIAVVREVARAFVEGRSGDRLGLVLFGSLAYVQTPLTTDHATVQHFIGEAVTGLAGDATAIGDAIGLSVKRLRERPDAARVLVLLTDGQNSAGSLAPLQAAELAAENGIRIHAIGIGGERRNRGLFGLMGGGQEIDEATLTRLAEATGGQYFRARTRDDLAAVYAEIDRLEPSEDPGERLRPIKELHVWPLSAALVLSMLWAWRRSHSGGVL
jgi:Ca-activated chloride channel family protein